MSESVFFMQKHLEFSLARPGAPCPISGNNNYNLGTLGGCIQALKYLKGRKIDL